MVLVITSAFVGWDEAAGIRSIILSGDRLVASRVVCGSTAVASTAVRSSRVSQKLLPPLRSGHQLTSGGVPAKGGLLLLKFEFVLGTISVGSPYVMVSTTTAETVLHTVPLSAIDVLWPDLSAWVVFSVFSPSGGA